MKHFSSNVVEDAIESVKNITIASDLAGLTAAGFEISQKKLEFVQNRGFGFGINWAKNDKPFVWVQDAPHHADNVMVLRASEILKELREEFGFITVACVVYCCELNRKEYGDVPSAVKVLSSLLDNIANGVGKESDPCPVVMTGLPVIPRINGDNYINGDSFNDSTQNLGLIPTGEPVLDGANQLPLYETGKQRENRLHIEQINNLLDKGVVASREFENWTFDGSGFCSFVIVDNSGDDKKVYRFGVEKTYGNATCSCHGFKFNPSKPCKHLIGRDRYLQSKSISTNDEQKNER